VGLSVYFEDQNHSRAYADGFGWKIELFRQRAADVDLLRDIHLHADTMFNVPQIERLIAEIQRIEKEDTSALSDAANELLEAFNRVIRNRGYLWISGD
jgi:hypothetical protein